MRETPSFGRAARPLALLAVIAFAGTARGARGGTAAPATWSVLDYAGACHEVGMMTLPADVGRIRLLADGGFVAVDQRGAVVRGFDGNGRLRFQSGRHGAGPGEYGLPTDAAPYGPEALVITDPVRMRLTVLSATGAYRRTIGTPGFAGKRAVAARAGHVMVGGLNWVNGRFRLAAEFDSSGTMVWSGVDAPALLEGIAPRIDESVLIARSDTTFVVANAALPVVWLVTLGGTDPLELPLDLPREAWEQRGATSDGSPEALRRLREHTSLFTAGAVAGEHRLQLAWRMGQSNPRFYAAALDLETRRGVLIRGVPSAVVALQDDRLWRVESEDAADVIHLDACAALGRAEG